MDFRTTMLDPNVASDPSSLPLYRDITSEDRGVGHGQAPHYTNGILRAKNRGK